MLIKHNFFYKLDMLTLKSVDILIRDIKVDGLWFGKE